MPVRFVTRFAPSPTGRLHLGHAYSALCAYDAAQAAGGRFLLRLEDIDKGRARAEFVDGIIEDLAWLGITWEQPVRRQSEHFEDYQAALASLARMGLLYPCFCTRKQIAAEIARSPSAPHGAEGPLYPGICRALEGDERRARIAAGAAHAWRLDLAKAHDYLGRQGRWPLVWHDDWQGEITAAPGLLGDVVLARKDVPTSYHLAVTVDDALQEITTVVRGADLFHATHIHVVLQALLDLPTPQYRHHRLLTDEAGVRFAKRDKAVTIAALRADRRTPNEVRAMLPAFGPPEALS